MHTLQCIGVIPRLHMRQTVRRTVLRICKRGRTVRQICKRGIKIKCCKVGYKATSHWAFGVPMQCCQMRGWGVSCKFKINFRLIILYRTMWTCTSNGGVLDRSITEML